MASKKTKKAGRDSKGSSEQRDEAKAAEMKYWATPPPPAVLYDLAMAMAEHRRGTYRGGVLTPIPVQPLVLPAAGDGDGGSSSGLGRLAASQRQLGQMRHAVASSQVLSTWAASLPLDS